MTSYWSKVGPTANQSYACKKRQVWTQRHRGEGCVKMEADSDQNYNEGLPWGAVVKNPPANAGHTGSSPGPGRSHMPQSN